MKIDNVKFQQVADVDVKEFKHIFSCLLEGVGVCSTDVVAYFMVWDNHDSKNVYHAEIGLNMEEGISKFTYDIDRSSGEIVTSNALYDVPNIKTIIQRVINRADTAFCGSCDCIVYENPDISTVKEKFNLKTGMIINYGDVTLFGSDTHGAKTVFGMVVEWI